MKRRVVLYYSLTDNTKEAAETIAGRLNADIFRIETAKPLPQSMAKQMFFGGMQATFGMKPKLKALPTNLSSYDEIIVGTPIWASKNAPAINTLLASGKVREKVTAVFTFSGGGDNDKCMAKLSGKLPNLKAQVALADRKNPLAKENEARLEAFLKEIM